MASMTMTASCIPSSAAVKPLSGSGRRGLAVVRASASGGENAAMTVKEEQKSKTAMRRDLVFAAAVTAAATLAKAALADDVVEPKRGTEDAKKKYASVCVTMPTAKICHK